MHNRRCFAVRKFSNPGCGSFTLLQLAVYESKFTCREDKNQLDGMSTESCCWISRRAWVQTLPCSV